MRTDVFLLFVNKQDLSPHFKESKQCRLFFLFWLPDIAASLTRSASAWSDVETTAEESESENLSDAWQHED